MNKFVLTIAISAAIAVFATITKPKPNSQESNMNYFIKIMVISFVCIFGGNAFFNSATTPEIDMGEPDF